MPAIGTHPPPTPIRGATAPPSTPATPPALSRAKSDAHEYARPSPPATPSKGKDVPIPPGPVLKKSGNGYFVIAHDRMVQELMDNYKLPWGVQYELGRGVTKGVWTWDDVPMKIKELKEAANKNMALAPSWVFDIMQDREWITRKELDREQHALKENNSRGLGLMPGEWHGESNWYGGKIQQILKLVERKSATTIRKDQGPPIFHVQLEAMEMGRSHRFARFLGSRRLLQMRVPKTYTVDLAQIKELLLQKLVLCGRVFVAFAVKDRKLHFVEIDEDYERDPQVQEGDVYRKSLEELVEWFNPMQLNQKQKINKWTTRFDLGLSTSIPILEFKPENMTIIDDLYADYEGDSAPTNKIFTDGCGFMNASGLLAISRQLGFVERTTAVQGRILGSKGVWALHPEHLSLDEPPRIWIRRSQQKIHLVRPELFGPRTLRHLSRAHFIFDLVAPARVWTPSRLSKSTIINLEYNSVPKEVLVKLMEEGLREEIRPLTEWHSPNAMPLLWNAVNKVSGVTPQRIERVANGMERATGISKRRDHDDDDDRDEEENEDDFRTSSGAKPDMPPYTIGEKVMDRLQAGFSPMEDRKLHEDLRTLVKETMKKAILEFHMTVAASAEAFIIPDPTGLLEEGQIHFTSTKYLKDPLVDANARTIVGDVLVFRNPARVASDVQKVTAVSIPELSQYVDVIVVPVHGEESLPSMLAGGDTAVCIWDNDLVSSFAQPEMVREPDGLLDNFMSLREVATVGAVLEEMGKNPNPELVLRNHLLTGLSDSRTGLYSMFHENTIWQYGYNHPNTIRNAFMFTTILDSRKSGLVLKEEVFAADRKRDGWAQPPCFGGPEDKTWIRGTRISKEPFILDELGKEGQKIQDELLAKYGKIRGPLPFPSEKDLARPWEDISNLNLPPLQEELQRVKTHVDMCHREWSKMWPSRSSSASSRDSDVLNKAEKEVKRKEEQRKKFALARMFVEGPEDCPLLTGMKVLETVRASCAYMKAQNFAWALAFRSLCRIKASTRNMKAFTAEFAQMMTIPTSAVRIMSQDGSLVD
ncbi:RNA dependent RNA polymerase-domain-containing protein [Irpex rosettiformis]|uniref:RNA dependent RNA polymerase-domain-containing protein n=1 Tax=Irpex rosettiformis TaxID=378272 RepID=A0ACB8U3Y7_9APHY|nr:RNA dependent RNA polymerase-domain-containing protein [Irpex rosettiformis]